MSFRKSESNLLSQNVFVKLLGNQFAHGPRLLLPSLLHILLKDMTQESVYKKIEFLKFFESVLHSSFDENCPEIFFNT